MVIEKRERLALVVPFQPQRYLAQIHSQRIQVHTINAMLNHITHRRAKLVGRGFVFISHVGEVYPSGFLPVSAGNVRELSLVSIYRDSQLFRDLRDPELLQGKCGVCDYRDVCGGSRARAYGVTGSLFAADPACIYEPPDWEG